MQLGGPSIEMKTGRRDSRQSYIPVEDYLPNHNDSISLVLDRFQSIGIDVEGTVALLGIFPPSLLSFFLLSTQELIRTSMIICSIYNLNSMPREFTIISLELDERAGYIYQETNKGLPLTNKVSFGLRTKQ